MELGQVHHIL